VKKVRESKKRTRAHKVAISGSNDFTDYDLLKETIDRLFDSFLVKHNLTIEIISGADVGAESLGECYAREKGYKLTVIPLNWIDHGSEAKQIRNMKIAEYADDLVVFSLGPSSGPSHVSRDTANIIEVAQKNNVMCHVYRF
jgi:hypothetical protein